MHTSFLQTAVFLLLAIVIIIILTVKYHVPAFFALLIACFVVGLGIQMPIVDIINTAKDGFGNIMKSLALLIILGTTLGVLLEHTCSTRVMADFILRKIGQKHAALAISVTGFIVGLPIFCDSGYIVLSGLSNSLSKKTGVALGVMSVSLATGLYSVHCLVPPHPGITAAAGAVGVDIGKVISIGVIVAIPAMFAGHAWAKYAGRKISTTISTNKAALEVANTRNPSTTGAFLPVTIPIILIALKSFFLIEGVKSSWVLLLINVVGDPIIAISVGILLAFIFGKDWTRNSASNVLQTAAEKAGGILVIIGAGGAFGGILAKAQIGEHLGAGVNVNNLGILFPFLLTVLLKTAQGSSTVAIITAASIIQPMLPSLGLHSANGPLLSAMAMGAGSMMVSHANDAYFWVIAKFSGLNMKSMLKVYSIATIIMSLVSLVMIYLISFIL